MAKPISSYLGLGTVNRSEQLGVSSSFLPGLCVHPPRCEWKRAAWPSLFANVTRWPSCITSTLP